MYKLRLQSNFKHEFHEQYYDICRKFRTGNRLAGKAVNTIKIYENTDLIKIYENTDLIKYSIINSIKDVTIK